MPCAWLGVDAMDISGEVQLEVDHDVYKRRLAADGMPLDDGARFAPPRCHALPPSCCLASPSPPCSAAPPCPPPAA